MEKRRGFIPLIVWFVLAIFVAVAAIIAPLVYNSIINRPAVQTAPVTSAPIVTPVSPGAGETIDVGVPPTEEVVFDPVAAIDNVKFCDTPDELGLCTSNSQSFDSSVKRVYATVSITSGKSGFGFNIAWYKVDGGNPELKLLDTYMINAAAETFTTSLSSPNDEFPLGSGTYTLKMIQEGTELGSYQFTVA